MTELHLLSGAGTTAATAAADALVVGVLPARADDDGEKGAPRLAPGAAAVDAAFDGELAALLAVAGATGRADEIVRIPTRGTVTRTADRRRRARPDRGRRPVGRAGAPRVRSRGPRARRDRPRGDHVVVAGRRRRRRDRRGHAPGLLRVHRVQERPGPHPGAPGRPSPRTPTTPQAVLRRATAVAHGRHHRARPGGIRRPTTCTRGALPPPWLRPAGSTGWRSRCSTREALVAGAFGGILGVGQGLGQAAAAGADRPHPPRGDGESRLRRQGHHLRLGRHLAEAGRRGNEIMKRDMSGAAAVFGTAVLAARPARACGSTSPAWLCAGREHAVRLAPSVPATCCGMYGGRTVEVLNTDAEGRLVLADALVRAGEERARRADRGRGNPDRRHAVRPG